MSAGERRARVYPDDAIAADAGADGAGALDVIHPRDANTVAGLLRSRVARSPDATAYIQYDGERWREYSWRAVADEVNRWRRALAADGLQPGARAAVQLSNRREWVLFDQACAAAGVVVVPLYVQDRADNVAYILQHTDAEFLLVENAAMWSALAPCADTGVASAPLNALRRVVVLDAAADTDDRVLSLSDWLANATDTVADDTADADDLATIVYTSGTTGKPKGVMLSHANMLLNAHAGLKSVPVFPADKFLSFLPLSHMFERTVGYYSPMMAGATVAFNRSIAQLADDLVAVRPTLMIAVPRIFERAHGAIQAGIADGAGWRRWLFNLAVTVGWRRFEIKQRRAKWNAAQLMWPALNALVAKKVQARFGGNLRFVISGGAPLTLNISKTFIALGVEVLQGYGLTETAPTLTVNTPARNKPASIGLPFIGVEIKLSDAGELCARGPNVMRGYWRDDAATADAIDADGWFATGDLAAIDADGFLSITGRLKEIIVLATGEKVPPADMEAAICDDPLFEQAMVVGEARAFLSALVVLNADRWRRCAGELGVDAGDDDGALTIEAVEKFLLEKIARATSGFPGYAAVRRVAATTTAWTVEDGALTPTLKLKRAALRERYQTQVEKFYQARR